MNAHVKPASFAAPNATFDPLPALEAESDFTNEKMRREIAEAGTTPTVETLAKLFHGARLNATFYRDNVGRVMAAARRLYPAQPEGLRKPGTSGETPDEWLTPERGCPPWRRVLYDRWIEQCMAIERGVGVPFAEGPAETADAMMDDLAARVEAAPVKTLADVSAKLRVLVFAYEGADEDGLYELLKRLEAEVTSAARA